mmetsp:Transcript_29444/g.80822  ORF Transcript_29444/g.80822 Transcript_29444/m.80822 type:complete len:231 (+) Transcript_29444:346-1038(+)
MKAPCRTIFAVPSRGDSTPGTRSPKEIEVISWEVLKPSLTSCTLNSCTCLPLRIVERPRATCTFPLTLFTTTLPDTRQPRAVLHCSATSRIWKYGRSFAVYASLRSWHVLQHLCSSSAASMHERQAPSLATGSPSTTRPEASRDTFSKLPCTLTWLSPAESTVSTDTSSQRKCGKVMLRPMGSFWFILVSTEMLCTTSMLQNSRISTQKSSMMMQEVTTVTAPPAWLFCT